MGIKEKLKKVPRGVKASLVLFLASVVTKGIAYITTPLFTRLLTTDEYGQVSVFLTWEHVLGIVAMFCLSSGVFNNGMLDYPDKRDEYSFSMLILSNLITVVFYGVVLCLYPLLRPWIGMDWPLMILMGVIFLFQPAYSFWTSRQRYELKYKASAAWTILCAVLSPLVAIVCILCFQEDRLHARIFGAYLTLIAIHMGFYIYQAVRAKGKLNTSYWKAAFLFNLPLIPHYLSTTLLGSADKLMIAQMVSDSATAVYSVAYSVASVATIVWTAINASLIPYTYEKCQKEDFKAISAVTLPILTGFAAICVLVIMLAPEVVAIMATKDYMEAIYAIPPVVGGVFFQVQYFIYANVVYYYKKPKYVMYASVTSVILNILLNYVCIKQFGYIAAGYTTLACYLLQATFDYFAMKKVAGRKIYNMRYLGALCAVVIFIALMGNLLYGLAVVRYVFVALIVVMAVVFRKKIISLILSIRNKA